MIMYGNMEETQEWKEGGKERGRKKKRLKFER